MRIVEEGVTFPRGFKAAGVHSGIKKVSKDLAIIYSREVCIARGMFTTNKVKAAPVELSLRKLKKSQAQAIVINSGNANTCTGQKGLQDAEKMAELVAQRLGIEKDLVLVASTGVIGIPLPMGKIKRGIEEAVRKLSSRGGKDAAEAILTTDHRIKQIAVETPISARGKGKVRIGAIAKGAGMISPQLATMLCFITTDVCITPDALDKALREAVIDSFNQISVDGDMSTNDSVIILANGLARNKKIKVWRKKKKIRIEDENFKIFSQALKIICTHLAREIIKDGEGATKLVEIKVEGASFLKDARRIAKSVGTSNLVKTALAGASPNWGRIMAALGSVHTRVKPRKVDIFIGDLQVVKGGIGTEAEEKKIREILEKDEIKIRINLNQGNFESTFWTCDLTEEYVKINKRYF